MTSDKTVIAFFVPEYTLTVDVQGQGSVSPSGGTYASGTQVPLYPSPYSGWQFDHWSGGVSGTSPGYVTMDSNKSVTAYFTQIFYTLTVNVQGQGSVSPSGGSYASGTVVSLSATPAGGWAFDHWTGGVSGLDPGQVTMSSNKTVIAVFIPLRTLTMAKEGEGSVNPDVGIHEYPDGESVSISATPASDWVFIQWLGDVPAGADPYESPLSVTMDSDKEITALFTPIVEVQIVYKNFIQPHIIEVPVLMCDPTPSDYEDPLLPLYAKGDDRTFDYASTDYRMRTIAYGLPAEEDNASGISGWSTDTGITMHFVADGLENGRITNEALADTVLDDCHLKDCQAVAYDGGLVQAERLSPVTVEYHIWGSGAEPCVFLACEIDYDFLIQISIDKTLRVIDWVITGDHDDYPWHEMYLAVDEYVETAYQFSPTGTVWQLCDFIFATEANSSGSFSY